MNSPAEIQVADGEEDVYLWPSEAIRDKAIAAVIARCERSADAKYKEKADATFRDAQDLLKKGADNFKMQAEAANAAYLRLEQLIKQAQEADVLENPNQCSPPPPMGLEHEVRKMQQDIREIGKVLYILNHMIEEAEQNINSAGVYISNSDMKGKLVASLIADQFPKKLEYIRTKMSSVLMNLQINGDY